MEFKFKALLICLFTLCCSLRCAYSIRGYYTVIAPGTIRSNSEYFVALSLDGFGGSSSWFKISVFPYCMKPLSNIPLSGPIEVEVKPNSTILVKMSIPKLTCACSKLKITGNHGILQEHEAQLHVQAHDYTVYIQTDKALYKPGELVQFRVICIDRLTRPAKVLETLEVFIYDGEKNLIKKFSDLKLTQGVFKGALQLSEYPVLGAWIMEVKADGLSMQAKSFDVARYQLAKFSVEIITKRDVLIQDGQIDVKVKSMYTYEQPVIGNLTVTLQVKYSLLSKAVKPISKHSPTYGEATISFNLDSAFNSIKRSNYIQYVVGITANVTNSLTGMAQSATTDVYLYRRPYKLQLRAPSITNPEELFNITVSVKDLQGNTVWDKENPVTITMAPMTLEIGRHQSPPKYFRPDMPTIASSAAYLSRSGVATFTLQYPKSDLSESIMLFGVKAEYLNVTTDWKMLNENISHVFYLDVPTNKPEVGKEFIIEIFSKDPIYYFVYDIISRGDIIKTDRIVVPGNDTKYHLKLNATYTMVPKVIFFMHRIIDSIMDSRFIEIPIKRNFQNSILIAAQPKAKPGESVSVNVTTDTDSYIGLMGIDESLLLNTNQNDDLNEDSVYTKLRKFYSVNMNYAIYPGNESGLVTFSNAINRAGYGIDVAVGSRIGMDDIPKPAAFDEPHVELPYVRKLFSESWIFRDIERSQPDGWKLSEKIPDTITSWSLTGFSLNPDTGLALTKNATKVQVFQEFFISFDLPNVVKAGEVVDIPVYVFNYLDEDVVVKVLMESSSDGIDLQPSQVISKSISAKGHKKVVYNIRCIKPGKHRVAVRAISNLASDAVHKTVTVKAEGVPHTFSTTYLVHFLQESEQEDVISVDIPGNAIQGSEAVQLSVVGDILGALINKLNRLVRVPYGNGAENMQCFISNLLVLKYLAALNHSIPVIENKAKLHLEYGYQTMFTSMHMDGSFAIVDRRIGRTGDIWLTAYVIRALQQAKYFITVSGKVIQRGLHYLSSKQGENGGFHSAKGVDEDVTLTSFIMLAFLVEEESKNQYQDVIAKGLGFLHGVFDNVKHPSSAALSTYALVLGQHAKSEELLAKLRNNATSTNKQAIWTKPDGVDSRLETIAHSFMKLLKCQDKFMQTLFPIVRSLISAEGLTKASVHIVALETMVKFASEMKLGTYDLNVNYKSSHGRSGDFHITTDNAQVLQTIELDKNTRNIRIQSTGKGFALIEVKYKYHLHPEHQSSSLYQTNVTLNQSTKSKSTLKVCIAIQLVEGQNNAALMKVNLQTGISIDESSFEVVKLQIAEIKVIQFDEKDHLVFLILQNITQNGICIPIELTKKFNVRNKKPVSVTVFEGHTEDQKSIMFYNE